jgi:hypothetical protein
LINVYINQVYYNECDKGKKVINDTYVLEIFVKMGEMAYCTPIKDNDFNDYECFIKLNGTLYKLEGKKLYKFMKMKIDEILFLFN